MRGGVWPRVQPKLQPFGALTSSLFGSPLANNLFITTQLGDML